MLKKSLANLALTTVIFTFLVSIGSYFLSSKGFVLNVISFVLLFIFTFITLAGAILLTSLRKRKNLLIFIVMVFLIAYVLISIASLSIGYGRGSFVFSAPLAFLFAITAPIFWYLEKNTSN